MKTAVNLPISLPIKESQRLRQSILSVFFLSFSGDLIFGTALFAAPLLAAQIGANSFEIGLVGASYGFTYWFCPFLSGRLSDKIGRKKSIFISYSIFIINSLFFFFATKIWMLIVAGMIMGISLSFHWPALGSLVVELSDNATKKHNVDVFMSSWNFGAILGPILAGLAYEFLGGHLTFIFLVIWCFGCLFVVKFGVVVEGVIDQLVPLQNRSNDAQETDSSSGIQTEDKWLGELPKQTKIYLYIFAYGMILLSSFYLMTLQSYYVGYAYLYTAYSPALIGLIVFCLPIGRGVAFALMGKVRVSQMLNLVPFLCLLAMILVFSVPSVANLSILILIFIITGFISGFAFSGSFYIVTGLSKERRGLFVGLLESTVGVSLATSTFVPFLILGNDPLSPFIFVLYVMGILAGLFFLIRLVLYFRLKISN